MKRETLEAVLAARKLRQGIAVVTDVANGSQRLVNAADASTDPLAEALIAGFRFDRSGMVETAQGQHFVSIHNPPLRLIIVGAVLIAQHVIAMARGFGHDVCVVDPRGAFATELRFPDVELHAEWPEDIMPKIGVDARTAVIALTHVSAIDDKALDLALKSSAFYIGALGSRKTQASRMARLAAIGFSETELARIRGPIGLPIGAVGGPEIALSILAEMTKALRLGLS
ncbi:MAG: XdhC family protein [Aestuariivirga sp.]